jgi:aryl-alcohol dehydrogenase-like predicted oxidoreductase
MIFRKLGGTDLDVSAICFGPMRFAEKQPGEDEKSKAGELALRKALDGGVNFIHSSYEYGTRWMMSRVLKDHPQRSDLHHVIKVPVPDFKDNDRFDPAKFRFRIEEALRDLHAERIAVLQWMWRSDPNDDDRRVPLLDRILDEVVEAFQKLRDEGKVEYLMTFPYTVACARAAMGTGNFAGIIAYYNLIETEMAELFDELAQRSMGFLCIRPLYQGILTDERGNWDSLSDDDRFKAPEYEGEFRKRERIEQTFREEIGSSMTRFAIRFALAQPLVASVIVGMNSPEQVDGMLAAVDEAIPSKDIVQRAADLWAP